MRTLGLALLVVVVTVGLWLLLVATQADAAGDFALIAPPVSQPGPVGGSDMNLSAPLRQWQRRGSFDTSAACFAALNAYQLETRSRLQGDSLGSEQRSSAAAALEHARATSARCVYSNDPRLKEDTPPAPGQGARRVPGGRPRRAGPRPALPLMLS